MGWAARANKKNYEKPVDREHEPTVVCEFDLFKKVRKTYGKIYTAVHRGQKNRVS